MLEENRPFTLPEPINKLNDPQERTLAHAGCSHAYRRVNEILGGLSLNEEQMATSWWNYLLPLWRILKTFKKNNREDAASRETAHRRGRGLRLFSLLPLTAFHRRFILIDTSALHDIFRCAGWAGHESQTLSVFRANSAHWWGLAFHVQKVVTGSRLFHSSIMTDGMSVSVNLDRPVYDWNGINRYGFDQEGKYDRFDLDISSDRVVGLDPGRRDLFRAVYGEEKGESVSCSTKEWYSITGFTRARKKRETWVENGGNMKGILRGGYSNITLNVLTRFTLVDSFTTFLALAVPTSGCTTIAEFQTYATYVLLHRDAILEFYGAVRWRRLRWKCHMGRSKAYDQVCKRITADDPETFVAFGDGHFSSSSRGHAPAPVKGLYKELKRRLGRNVRLVDEYKTSIMCSKCTARMDGRSRIWALKMCKNTCLVSVYNSLLFIYTL